MAIKNKTYSIHLLVALLTLFIPLLVTFSKYSSRENNEDINYNKPNLTGIVISDEKAKFTFKDWLNGDYQTKEDDYNEDHWAFKEGMVRWNNQVYYNLFNQIRVNGFVTGKEDYLFSESYIFAAFGDDLIDEKLVEEKLRKAKVLQDTLKRKGIDLILAFAPGKGSFCKEFVQDKYVHPIKNTNHNLFIKHGKKNNLNILDLYTYFEMIKKTSPYPLFPKFGHHWSYYGACIATDTIIKYIEHLRQVDLPACTWNEIEVVDTARSRDADVLKSMNLNTWPNQNMKLAYPKLLFENDSLKNKTRVLTISDSYWYDQVYMGVPQNCFAGGQFWYYYNKVIPSPIPGEKVEVWQLDLKKEIESNKVIMLLYSDGNLTGYGNAFINDTYELYTNPKAYYERNARDKVIKENSKQIRDTPLMLKKATSFSNNERITLDSAINFEAMKMAGLLK